MLAERLKLRPSCSTANQKIDGQQLAYVYFEDLSAHHKPDLQLVQQELPLGGNLHLGQRAAILRAQRCVLANCHDGKVIRIAAQ